MSRADAVLGRKRAQLVPNGRVSVSDTGGVSAGHDRAARGTLTGSMTRRGSTYRSLLSLQRDNRVCRACAEAGYPIESLPVLQGRPGQRAYMLGQAPGIVEGDERRPWRGRAGKTLRRWLDMDEDEFYDTFYCASVTRCYPGRDAARGDRTPTPREQELCRFWREWELALLRPGLVVTVGGVAARRLLGLTTLSDCVGTVVSMDNNTVAIPLPHPSGASGWLNDPANRERVAHAADLVKEQLARLRA